METLLRRWVHRACGIALAAGVSAFAACQPGPEQTTLILSSGPEGGVYHALGGVLEEVSADWDIELQARSSGASVHNLELVAQRSADVGFTISDVAAMAVDGEPPFAEPLPIAAIAKLYDNHTHLVVRADHPAVTLQDLAADRISLGPEGSGTELLALRLLDVAGLNGSGGPQTTNLDLRESTTALEAGEIDALFWSGGLPTDAITELAERTPVRLLDLSEHLGALSEGYGSHYSELPVPLDAYPGVPGVRTIGVASLLVVSAEMPRVTAQTLTEELFASRSELIRIHPAIRQLHERAAVGTLPVPLHPGAQDHYERVKIAHHRGE